MTGLIMCYSSFDTRISRITQFANGFQSAILSAFKQSSKMCSRLAELYSSRSSLCTRIERILKVEGSEMEMD